ncbi:MAG: hypothetical protein ABW217_15995 [Polyangiaceae bacterium]
MKRPRGARARAASLAALALLASPVRAQAPSEPRFELGLRTGYGLPIGHYADVRQLGGVRQDDVNALSDDAYGAIPLWLDFGYRLTPALVLGVYGMFGLVLPKSGAASNPLGGGCPEGLDCFAIGVRFGVQAQYHFSPGAQVDPWLGLGLGYEWITSHVEGSVFGIPIDVVTDHAGLELLHLQGGVDFPLARALSLGPFASVSALQYTSCSAKLDGDDSACSLPDKAWHGWLVLGVRGRLGL